MNHKVTHKQIISRFDESNLSYLILELQRGVSIIISQRGGRIFGPFLSPDSESVFWANEAFAQTQSFKDFLDSRDWNLGGERIWVAPEIQYHIPNRSDFWGSYTMPAQVDPGHYVLDQPKPGRCWLYQDMELKVYGRVPLQKKTISIKISSEGGRSVTIFK